MVNVRFQAAVAQVVTSPVAAGGATRAVGMTLQSVLSNTGGARVRTSGASIQTISANHPRYIRVLDAALQAVVKSSGGSVIQTKSLSAQIVVGGAANGLIRDTSNALQVVYTTGVASAVRQRAWPFEHDGHTFYALDLGANGTLVYDITEGRWSHYDTQNYLGHWNMKNGMIWHSAKKVLAGDISNGTVYELDLTSFLDNDFRPVIYEVNGVLFATDIGFHRQYALRLMGSAGRTADLEAPVLNMKFSDDNGATWSNEYSVTLTADSQQRIEFRSLGAFSAPGRIFRLYDTGGVKFIAYVMAEVDGK